MGTLATALLAVAMTLGTEDSAPPSHDEIIRNGSRLVDAPDHQLGPEPIYETDDQEIICPPPTRLRCWIAAADGGVDGSIYCSCRK